MNLIVSSSPHIRSKIRTQTIMRDVLIALLPALLAGIWIHGLRALLVTLTAAAPRFGGRRSACNKAEFYGFESFVSGYRYFTGDDASGFRTLLGSGPWKYLCDCGCERHERRYR